MPVLNLSYPCPSVDVKNRRNIAFSLYCPSTRTPALGVMKFATLVDSSLVIITVQYVFLNYVWELKKLIFKEKYTFIFPRPCLMVMK